MTENFEEVRQVEEVPPKNIQVRPQVRKQFDADAQAALVASIRANGIMQPVLCRKHQNMLILVDGERRLRAALELNLPSVPVLLVEDSEEAVIAQKQLTANIQREDLTAMEKADALEKFQNGYQWTQAQICERLGLTPSVVSKLLALKCLPLEIQAHVRAGKINASAGYELSRLEDANRQSELAQKLLDGNLNREALATAIRSDKKASAVAQPPSADSPPRRRFAPSRVSFAIGQGRTISVSGDGLTLPVVVEHFEELLAKAKSASKKGLALSTFAKMIRDQAKEPEEPG